jgi:lipopolysaccharide export system permease protein
MTFGNLAENYEFAAMKSAGISLQRAMKSLIIFISLLSFVAFMFANDVIPYAEYKFINFRRNIAQLKPAMAIAEGQFSDVGLFNIKVNKKSGKDGNTLTGITIHKKSPLGDGNKTVIKAKNGELISSEKSSTLHLVLNDGNYYEDVATRKYEDMKKVPFAKSTFKKYIINIDLSKLNAVDVNNSNVSNTNTMLNLSELKYTLDSLHKNMDTDISSFSENINQRVGVLSGTMAANVPTKNKILPKNLLSIYKNDEKLKVLNMAIGTVDNNMYSIDGTNTELENKQKNINAHLLAFYDKFVIAYACFLMFFIGAPLGAIIRKGGLGLPIVFAVLIFISFHFINTFGKRVSQEDQLSPFLGAWLSSIILTPLAVLLTYRATNDIGLINMDVILAPFQKLFLKVFPPQK